MEKIDNLTTEKLRKKFKSQFELVNYSIRLAENMIRSGREPRVKMDIQNSAMQVLGEIVAGVDKIDELPAAAPVQATVQPQGYKDNYKGRDSSDDHEETRKPVEKKKHRKILA